MVEDETKQYKMKNSLKLKRKKKKTIYNKFHFLIPSISDLINLKTHENIQCLFVYAPKVYFHFIVKINV